MSRLKTLIISVFIFLSLTYNITSATQVKAFVPDKQWQITINLNNFMPWDFLGDKTILGGNNKDGITITIIIEKTKPGTDQSEIRKIYGYGTALNFGIKESIEEIDINNIAIIAYKWSERNIPDLNEQQTRWAKDVIKDIWGYHGYVVKDDIAFDIHVSADMSEHTKEQMLDIIKSFQIKPSTELDELKKLYEELYKEFNKNLDTDIQIKERLKFASDFIKKYPTNPEVQVFMGDYYLETNELEQAKNYYLKALDNHRIQPFINPTTLWTCYDGLGMYYGMSGKYEQSKQYLEPSYNLAKDTLLPLQPTTWPACTLKQMIQITASNILQKQSN